MGTVLVPARKDLTSWSNELELMELRRVTEQLGMSKERAANYLNEKFHKGEPIRSEGAVSMMRTRKGWKVAPNKKGGEQEVEREEVGDRIILKSNGSRIKTVAELVAHGGIDTTKWEIDRQKLKAYDSTMRGDDGSPVTIQNFSLHVEVVRKQGASVTDAVEAIIAGAFAKRTVPKVAKHAKVAKTGLMQALFIMDPHIGKRAYGRETRRGDYDTPIAVRTLREANAELISRGNARGISERVVFVGGDFYNADTKAGTTTGGTPQDNDSRIPKMIEEGSKALFEIIELSAAQCPTKVMLVPGNHDSTAVWSLQYIIAAYFRNDGRVTVDMGQSTRKYHRHGKCLIGLTHGDKALKRLPGLMAREAALEWGQTTMRHIHHGHFHCKRQIDTVEGVTMFQHPALCESDSWHSEEGYVSDRGQESYYYHQSGILVGMDYYSPDMDLEVAKGVR